MGKTLGYGEITVANMTEPFTVMLTNEAQQFATDSNRKVTSTQSYYTDIIVIRGSQERTDYTIGNITSSSGITVSKNSKRVTFSVSAGTTIGADAGVIEIPITLDGQTVKKQFSWSCGKQGPQGVKGNDGNSFAWNMLSETNCGKKHWGTESSGGKYSVEDFITEDNIDAVKLICTEAISTSNWSYVLFKDIKMLKQLKPSTKYTLSYDIKANRSGAISHSICKGDVSNFCTNTVVVNNIIGNETWQHISVVLTTNDLKTTPTNEILYLGRNALSKVGYSIIKNLKLVEGDIDTPWSPSQSDIEGRGVAETVQYYLAASQASGVTSSTSGWSTDITTQKLTADKKYLWNCYQTKYSDGTSEPISTPKVIGVYGDKGQNAKNLSITPSSQYFKSTDGGKTFAPNTITIKPTIQGEIKFGKWQYSIDGGVSFADVVSGQKGLTISNNVLSISKDSSLYSDAVTMVTFRAVANDSSFYDTCSVAKIYDVSELEIGGVNLFVKSTVSRGYWLSDTGVLNANGGWGYSDYIDVSGMKNYIASGFTNLGISPATCFYDSNKTFISGVQSTNQNSQDSKRKTLPIPSNAKYMRFSFMLVDIDTLKIEQGTKATAYSPSHEDVQTAILSTKSEISDVSSQVDKNKQAIEQRVTKTTYQQDLNLVKGDISKANEGLNKWRYEIYPKSLFTDKPEDQRKISLDVFARNKNIIPTQSILLDDTKLGQSNYDDNYIGYAVTFVKMSEATKLETTFVHDDAGSFYLNGKLICTNGTNNFYSSATPDTVSCTLVKGWNCLEVVINEGAGSEGFKFGTVLSQLSTCQLMNCYYAMVTGRESQITNTLVQNTTDIEGVTTKVGKVTSVIGENGENFTSFKNDYSDFKQTMNGFKTTVGQTYVTKDDFNGLEIGGRNLLLYSQTIRAHNNYYDVGLLTDEAETFNGCPVWSLKKQWGKLIWLFKSHVIDRGLVKVGDTLTYSLYAKTNNTSGKRIACSYRFKGNAQAYWFKGAAFNIGTSWARYSATFTVTKDMLATDTYMNEIGFEETVSMSGDDKVYFACPKLERGTKATDYTEAPEDDEINGQNLVSNLPSNWEQGGINGGQAVGSTYASIKSSTAYRIRIKDIFSVSGNIAVSAGGTTTNSAKETLSFYGTLYDAKKGLLRETGWKSFPSTINCGDAKYMSIILRWGDGTKTQIAPSDISQICLKIERGTSATPFTLAPEDVNGKIVNVETIANQTAKKFEWIVKGGDSSSNFTLTDRVADLVAERINFKGLVKFSGLAKSTQDKINSPTSGNLITVSPTNPTSNYGNTTFSIVSDDAGGRCIQTTAQFVPFTNYASNIFKPGEQIYYNINVPNWSSTTFDANLGIWFFTAEKKCVANSCTRVTLQRTTWNRLSGYITVPTSGWSGIIYYVIGIENPNKYQLGLVSNSYIEKTTSYATTYASSAVNWVTSNGSSTTSLNSMVKKWTDGAVSDTAQINGGWIKANTITASKIAVGDFTNYADICESNTHGFSVEKTTDGVWFSKDGSKLIRDNYISKMYSCEPGQTFYVEYDISNTIKDSTEYKAAGIMLFGCDGTQAVKWYQRRGAVVGTAAGTVTHMSQQLTMPSGTRFFYVVLQIEGHPPFTGTLKIRNLSVRKAVTGAVIVDGSITADKIATDAIKSRNYISSGGTQGSFLNLGDGSFTSPNLSWDSNGNLIAKNANLSGYINATQGSIGGWNIGDTSLFTGITKSNVRIYDAVNADNAQNMYQKEQHSLILANTYINSFNSSLNSSDHYWHAQGVTINDGEFQVAETLYDPNLVNSDKDRVYYDRGLTRVFGGSITMSRDYSINSDSHSLYAGITFNGEELYIYTSSNILFSPHRTSIFTTEDTSKYNAIETIGDVVVNGKIKASNELQTTASQMRIISGSIGCMLRNDSADFYILRTNAGDPYGDWTNDRPFRINWASNDITCGHNLAANDLIANGWIYNASGGHYTWQGRNDAYISCGNYNNTNNIYYYAGYHAFYVNGDSGSGMMYIETSGVSSRKGFRKSSDERIKQNFSHFDDNFIDTYMNLEPVQYQFKNDTNDKYHFGFKAQQTERILNAYGQESDKSYGLCATHAIDPEKAEKLYGVKDMHEEYTLAYDELIAPTTYMVQHTYKELESTKGELEQVKQEKADLEARLQAIEAKLRL